MTPFLVTLGLIFTLTAKAFTIGAYNIRNFDYDERYRIRTDKKELSTMLTDLKIDVLSVEEINNTKEFENFVASKLPGFDTEVTRCGGAHGQRLGFLFNKATVELLSFNEDLATSMPGAQGACDGGSRPMAIALFQIKATKQKFYAFTVHLKSGSAPDSMATRNKQYQIIKNTIVELKTKTGVKDFSIGGDLNTTEYLSKGNDYKELNKVVADLGMVSLTTNLKCSAYWWGGTDDGIETPSLLDHVIVTPGLIKASKTPAAKSLGHCAKVTCKEASTKDLGISYQSVSDHCPVTATIQ